MRICDTSKSLMSKSDLLTRLAAILHKPGMPTQSAISHAIGVDQPMVSRARNGELKRVTKRVRRLYEYADRKAAELDALTSATATRVGKRPSFTTEVLKDCKDYLRDGYDPAILRDQLKVLRRAQGSP